MSTRRTLTQKLADALRPFVVSHEKHADPVGDSDLYDEQPRSVSVTLGDCRRAFWALREFENFGTHPDWKPSRSRKAAR